MLFDRLQFLCKKNGTTVTALCKEITGSTGNYSTWKKGNIRNDYLVKIADYFTVSTDYLLGKTDQPNVIAPFALSDRDKDAIELADRIAKLPPDAQALIDQHIDFLLHRQERDSE